MTNESNIIFSIIEPINKGWSGDKKYYTETHDGQKILMRIANISEYAAKKLEFEMMNTIENLGISAPRPIEFGVCEDERGVYSLLTWCDGEDLDHVMPSLTETEQYALGLESGKMLKKIHSIPSPDNEESWEEKYGEKIDRKIRQYLNCGIELDDVEIFLEYIKNNRHLIKNRPQSLQHGDYHIGNMVISSENNLSVIDFNRLDFGDPWEDFHRILWSALISPYFSSGQLYGYFDGKPPMEFWRILLLYMSINVISSVPWAAPFGSGEVQTMKDNAQEILVWFDNLKNPVPTWYVTGFYFQYIDDIPYRLKSKFDMSFISRYGRVFKIYDDQDSGNICFGVQNNDEKYFIKFAGAPTIRLGVNAESAIQNLKASVSVYRTLLHPNLIKILGAEEIGGGFAAIFKWEDGECMGKMYPRTREKFMMMKYEEKLDVFDKILLFHEFAAKKDYIAVDFYDGSVIYNPQTRHTTICDIDFYTKKPLINYMGRMWGSSRFMSPEEFTIGAEIDEITNVYLMGATAFALFGDEIDRTMETWQSSKNLFCVAQRAVSNYRYQRQQSIREFINEWNRFK